MLLKVGRWRMFDNFKILTQYSFIVVALGTSLLAISTAMIGSVNILKGQSLIGDAVGHSSFLGVVLAFLLFTQKHPVILMCGAIVAGVVAFSMISTVANNSKVEADTAMAIILSAFFGLGMVFKSYMQGNSKFSKASQSGLANYIFGQAAYMLREDVVIIFAVSIIAISLFVIFYKEIKIHVFDSAYAKTIGINEGLMSGLIMFMTMVLIAAGLKAVGTILISSMLITPAVVGMQWSDGYDRVLLISAIVGAFSALSGTILSSLIEGFSTGPSIVLVMSVIAVLSVLLSPKGLISTYFKKRR